MEGQEEQAIGIDLGTTYSCVAVWQHGRVEIIPNEQGNRTTPSYVAFTEAESLVGDGAINQVARNPTNTVFGTYVHLSTHTSLNLHLHLFCLSKQFEQCFRDYCVKFESSMRILVKNER